MAKAARRSVFWGLVGLWFAAGLGLAFGASLLHEWLWIAFLAVPAIWGAVGLGLLAVSVWQAVVRRGSWRAPAAVIALAGLVAAVTIPLVGWGEALVIHARLERARPAVAAILEQHAAGRWRDVGWQDGDAPFPFVVDAGPPRRIAFLLPGGIIDNWAGIVYDPSGLVMRANRFAPDWSNWDDPAMAPVKALFGGDLFSCEPLDGPFYRCSFT